MGVHKNREKEQRKDVYVFKPFKVTTKYEPKLKKKKDNKTGINKVDSQVK